MLSASWLLRNLTEQDQSLSIRVLLLIALNNVTRRKEPRCSTFRIEEFQSLIYKIAALFKQLTQTGPFTKVVRATCTSIADLAQPWARLALHDGFRLARAQTDRLGETRAEAAAGYA